MSKTLTLKQRADRETEVSDLIAQGKTVAQMAEALSISTQAVRKFLKVRGWTISSSK